MRDNFKNKSAALGFGAMRLPQKEGAIDHAAFCAMIDRFLESGFTYFDTAYVYHSGKSETALKEALVKRCPRDSFQLADKLPGWLMKSAEDADRLFNEQLERTGVDYFDFYLLHSVDEGNAVFYDKYDCWSWLEGLKKKGLAKHIGFSFHGTPEQLEKLLTEHPQIEFVQLQINYVDWEAPGVRARENYEIVRRHGKPVVIMEPVKGGMLSGLTDIAASPMRASEPDASLASWALRFAGSLEGVITVLSGMGSGAQMEENIATFCDFKPLTEAERGVIGETVRRLAAIPTVGCTACRYCCDGCPESISIPDLIRVLNEVKVYGMSARAKNHYRMRADGHPASACIACGQCESVCPQQLPIIGILKEISEKFER